MKRINKNIIILINLLIIFGCSEKSNIEQTFIEQNFLIIVDTLAYNTGSFVTLPSDTISYPALSVELSKNISYNDKVEKIILNYFDKDVKLKKTFDDVLDMKDKQEIILNSNFPNKIGKYSVFLDEANRDKNIKYAGAIGINNLRIKGNKAILVLSEYVEHYGNTYIVLLIKENNQWRVFKRDLLWQS